MKNVRYKRGDVVIVDLRGAEGSEQKKVRPCLVIQNDIGNKYSPTTIVVPIGHKSGKLLPTHVEILKGMVMSGDKSLDGTVLVEQIRTVDKVRITKDPIARLGSRVMSKVDYAMKVSMNLL